MNLITILALGFNVCNSWIGIGSSIVLFLASDGTVSLLYGILISTVVYLSTAATLAELAAVYPTAGGQYHFTSILAPERFSKSLSYACGITSVFSWIALSAAITISTAQSFIAITVMLTGNYEPETWHYFMVFQCLALLGLLYNLFALKNTPWVHNIASNVTEKLNLFPNVARHRCHWLISTCCSYPHRRNVLRQRDGMRIPIIRFIPEQ